MTAHARPDALAVSLADRPDDAAMLATLTLRRLQAHAERRGVPVEALVVEILEHVARANLVDAVLDDRCGRRS